MAWASEDDLEQWAQAELRGLGFGVLHGSEATPDAEGGLPARAQGEVVA